MDVTERGVERQTETQGVVPSLVQTHRPQEHHMSETHTHTHTEERKVYGWNDDRGGVCVCVCV